MSENEKNMRDADSEILMMALGTLAEQKYEGTIQVTKIKGSPEPEYKVPEDMPGIVAVFTLLNAILDISEKDPILGTYVDMKAFLHHIVDEAFKDQEESR